MRARGSKRRFRFYGSGSCLAPWHDALVPAHRRRRLPRAGPHFHQVPLSRTRSVEAAHRARRPRAAAASRRRRRHRRWIAARARGRRRSAYVAFAYRPAVQVEIGTAAQVYPSQAYTVLNATGYVVAQRKAAVASKATGRLEWLGVREGSDGESAAKSSRGSRTATSTAQMEQAAANIKVAEANLEQGEAELKDAERAAQALGRAARRRISCRAAAHDTVVARHARAQAGDQRAFARRSPRRARTTARRRSPSSRR